MSHLQKFSLGNFVETFSRRTSLLLYSVKDFLPLLYGGTYIPSSSSEELFSELSSSSSSRGENYYAGVISSTIGLSKHRRLCRNNFGIIIFCYLLRHNKRG